MIEFNIKHIDSAILKSRHDKNYTIYRGIKSIKWIGNPGVGDVFTEEAFGSFSLNFYKALEYTNPKSPIILQLKLEAGKNALYMDDSEKEMLRPRNSVYWVAKIEAEFVEKYNTVGKIYYIEELKE